MGPCWVSAALLARGFLLLLLLLLLLLFHATEGILLRCTAVRRDHVLLLESSEAATVIEVPVDEAASTILRCALERTRPLRRGELTRLAAPVLRDGGLFDALPWEGQQKREAFNKLSYGRGLTTAADASPYLSDERRLVQRWRSLKRSPEADAARAAPSSESYYSPYCIVSEIVVRDLGWTVDSVGLERASFLDSRALGGFVALRRGGGDDDDVVVECSVDEAVGLALARGMALDVDDGPVFEEAPGDTTDLARAWLSQEPASSLSGGPLRSLTAEEFREMRPTQRAARLARRCPEVQLPRPRRLDNLNRLLLDRMDETERRRVLVANDDDDLLFSPSAESPAENNSPSARSRVAAALRAARAVGADTADLERRAAILIDAVADTTQDPGSYDRFLDKDDWYEEGRRRCMRLDAGSSSDAA